jgi:hypothetical protein
VSFLWHFPWGFPRWPLASTLLFGVRTFLESHATRGCLACAGKGSAAPQSLRITPTTTPRMRTSSTTIGSKAAFSGIR